MDIKVSSRGSSILVDFGDMLVEIPTGYKSEISNVKLGAYGLVCFKNNDGERDYISIPVVAFGHEPYFVPSDFTILEDRNGQGVAGFNMYAKMAKARNGKTLISRLAKGRKANYVEVMMVLGEVICVRADESGEIYIKIYNDYGKPYVAYYGICLSEEIRLIRSSYPTNLQSGITELLSRNLDIIFDISSVALN